MMFLWLVAMVAGVGAIVWGAEPFAEHLGKAAVTLGVSSFALALLLAGAEPEELATALVASLRGSPGIALGDVGSVALTQNWLLGIRAVVGIRYLYPLQLVSSKS
jgi:cation:H+ antiporter